MPRMLPAMLLAACLFSGCGSGVTKSAKTFPSGEKATAGALIYSVVDVHIVPRLGDDPTTARTPKDRFFLIKISASNSSANEVSIPSLTLIDDHGKVFSEVADGTNVPDWLGVLRKIEPGQTGDGVVIFDAPSQHYRLRLTDETDEDIGIDIPLTFVNESAEPATPPFDPGAQPIQIPRNKE